MALTSSTPWGSSSLKLSEVSTFFNVSLSLGEACHSNNINQWALYKPIGTPLNNESSLDMNVSTETDVRFRSGFKIPAITSLSNMFNANGTIKKQSFEAYPVTLCRLGDFRGYYHQAPKPVTSLSISTSTANEVCKNYNNDYVSCVLNFVRSTDSGTKLYFRYGLSLESLGLSSCKLALVFVKKDSSVLYAKIVGNNTPLITSDGIMYNALQVNISSLKKLDDGNYYVYPILWNGSRSITGGGPIELNSDDGVQTLALSGDSLLGIEGLDGYKYSIDRMYTIPCVNYSQPYSLLVYSIAISGVSLMGVKSTGGKVNFTLAYKSTSLKDLTCSISISLRKTKNSFGSARQLNEYDGYFQNQTIKYSADNVINSMSLTDGFSDVLTNTTYYYRVIITTTGISYNYSATFGADSSLTMVFN